MESIILISSDNHKIEIDSKSAQKSSLLKKIVSDSEKPKEQIRLKNIKYDILKKVADFLEYYKNKPTKQLSKPIPSEYLTDFLEDWDIEFINSINLDETFELMNAASELGIQSLLDLASAKVAAVLKNREIEDIRNMFNTGCDLSQKELKRYEELLH